MAFSQRVFFFYLWRLKGVSTAYMVLAWSFYRVCKAFSRRSCARVELLPHPMACYDKKTQTKINKKNMQILNMTKQTKYYLNEIQAGFSSCVYAGVAQTNCVTVLIK